MLDEVAVRKMKSNLSAEIEHLNTEISKMQREIDENKKRIWINQAELKTVNKILGDQ